MTTTLSDLAQLSGSTDLRVRAFVEAQQPLWQGQPGDWVVIPVSPQGAFALASLDVEGERRGREVVRAFVGPGTAKQAPTARPLRTKGIVVRAVDLDVSRGRAEELLESLEVLVSARLGVTRHVSTRKLELADLLRDMRLGLAISDWVGANNAYAAIDELGLLSRENRRFLEIEFLAESKRWSELVSRPYFGELPRVRRPRQITEYMQEAVWFGIVLRTGQTAFDSILSESVIDRFGPLLNSPDVPRRQGALCLVYLTSLIEGDTNRVDRILASVDEATRSTLKALEPVRPEPAPPEPTFDAVALLALGRFGNVVEAFLLTPRVDWVDSAVEATLEMQDATLARSVLELVEEMILAGFEPRPRSQRAIDELRYLAEGECGDWLDWARRSASSRWEGAAAVARENADAWQAPSGAAAGEFADLLLEASNGANAQAVVSVLDLLLRLSRDCMSEPSGPLVCDAVLLVLSDQDNASDQVRGAFAELAVRALDRGVSAEQYRTLVQAAEELWAKVASPLAFDWALEVLDALAISPCPVAGLPTAFASSVEVRASAWMGRLTSAQTASMRSLTEELGLPVWPPEGGKGQDDESVWLRLDGSSLGLYSLTENAGTRLKRQLDRVCSLGSFVHNRDHTATAGLASLAQNADYLIVDTWHAAHSATACIDQYRPRSEQILPRRGSTPALMAALEDRLRTRDVALAQ